MSDSKIQVSGGGISFSGLLFIVFLVLKLTGVIGWSWWWITAPLWGGLALVIALPLLILGFVVLCGALFAGFVAIVSLVRRLLKK